MQSHAIHPSGLFRSLILERLRFRVLILVFSAIAALCGLAAPLAQRQFIDALTGHIQADPYRWIGWAFALTLGAQTLSQLSLWVAMREAVISQKAMGDAAYSRILEGPGGLIGRRPAGEAVSLFAVDVAGASALLDQTLIMAGSMVFPLLIAPVALKHIFGIPVSASLIALGVLLAVNFVLASKQSGYFRIFKQLAAERTGLVAEWVQNIRALRILGWVEPEESRIFDLRRRETRNRKVMVTNGQVMNAIATTGTFFLNILAVLYLMHARGDAPPSGGELLSLLWILGVFLSRPIRQMPWVMVIGLDSITSIARLQKAYSLPVALPRVNAEGAPSESVLSVRGLRLRSDDRELLRGIDLDLGEGELVGLVGEVGSGKSLLLQSLIGGTGATFESFRLRGHATQGPYDPRVSRSMAFVPQEGFTISASLRENVRFEYLKKSAGAETGAFPGDPDVIESLKLSQFDLTIERVAGGIGAEIGERGVNLSGGQRQRVGLARAHFASRDIVLLDDCLSAVDVDTEKRLVETLICGAWKKHARLLVTHRLSVLPLCDRVLFIEDGAIAEQGTYTEVLARSDRFRDYVRREATRAAEKSKGPDVAPGPTDTTVEKAKAEPGIADISEDTPEGGVP